MRAETDSFHQGFAMAARHLAALRQRLDRLPEGQDASRQAFEGLAEALETMRQTHGALVRQHRECTARCQSLEAGLARPAEEAKRQDQGINRMLVDSLPEGIWLVDKAGYTVFANPRMAAMLGYSVDEMVGAHVLDFVDDKYRDLATEGLQRCQEGIGENLDFELSRKDGLPLYANIDVQSLFDADGNYAGVLAGVTDMTERRRASDEQQRLLAQATSDRQRAEKMAASAQRDRDTLQAVMESTRSQVAYLDPDFNFLLVNTAYAEGSGHSKEELLGRNHFDLFPNPENQAIFERVRDTGRTAEYDARPFEFADQPERGTTYWDWSLVPVADGAGQVRGLVLSLSDVTRQVRDGQHLDLLRARAQHEADRAAAVFAALAEPLMVFDAQGGIVSANPAAVEALGVDPINMPEPELARRMHVCTLDGQLIPAADLVAARALRGEHVRDVYQLLVTAGGERAIVASAAPIVTDGQVSGAVTVWHDITDLRRTEAAWRESEEKLSALFEIVPVGLSVLDQERHILKQNPALARILGSREAALESGAYERWRYLRADGTGMPAEELPSARALKDQREVRDVEVGIIQAKGERIWTRVGAVPLPFGDWRVAVVTMDITERKRTEEALREANERLEFTMAASGAGAWDWDIPAGLFQWSPRMFDLLGLDITTAAASMETWRSVVHPEDLVAAERRINAALEAHSDLDSEYRVIWPDGAVRWISALGRGFYDEQGQPYRMSGLCLDITDLKLAREKLEHLSSFPELNPNPVLEVDASGTLVFCNAGATAAAQRSGAQDGVRAFLPEDLSAILQESRSGRGSELQYEVQVGSATFSETVQVIPAFNVVRIYAFEVTRRKEAQEGLRSAQLQLEAEKRHLEATLEALRASQEKFAAVFRVSPTGLVIARASDGVVLDVNDAFTGTLGYQRSELIGARIGTLGLIEPGEARRRLASLIRQDQPIVDNELEFKARDGEIVTMLVSAAPIQIGDEACILGVARDITQRKRMEEALRRREMELALVSHERAITEERQRLARELHDSVSQALYGVSLGINTALTLFDVDRDKVFEALNYSLSQTQAGLAEMRSLIFALRPEALATEGLVAALNKETAGVIARRPVEIDLSLCDEPDASFEVKEALYRIAQEALQNAVKHARCSHVTMRLAREEGGLTLEVGDDGVGFDPQASYPGHLGLRSMHERALRAGGSLAITSSSGEGTRVRVHFPACVDPAP